MTRYDAYIFNAWQTSGLATVVVSRVRDGGITDSSFFLVDTFCLGVKDAMVEGTMSESEFTEFLDLQIPAEMRERFHPACAKRLIDGAVDFAERLGISPCRDFRKARKILSGLDASQCDMEFSYGRDGRPCYVPGPDDSDERIDRVLALLEARCGVDGFDYSAPEEMEADEDEVIAATDWEIMLERRVELQQWLGREKPGVPNFYEMSGMVTAMLLSPASPQPMDIEDILWREPRVWRDRAEIQEFLDLLMSYWNLVNTLILATIEPGTRDEPHPVDIWESEFEGKFAPVVVAATAMLWARGFVDAVEFWKEQWVDTLKRPDLRPHWHLIRAYAEIKKKGGDPELRAAIREGTSFQLLMNAVSALARALRNPV